MERYLSCGYFLETGGVRPVVARVRNVGRTGNMNEKKN